MSRLLVILAVLIVVVLTIYGSVKLFHEVRAEWRDWCSRRDSKAAKRRTRSAVLDAIPARLDELSRLHGRLSSEIKNTDGWLGREQAARHALRDQVREIRSDLDTIRRALKGYI